MTDKAKRVVAAENKKLRLAGALVRFKIIGGAIVLRATLPPKPGSSRTSPYQQEVYIGSGLNKAGLTKAKRKRMQLENELLRGDFDWDNWRKKKAESRSDRQTANYLVPKFQEEQFSKSGIKAGTQAQWIDTLRRIPQDEPITAELLRRVVLGIDPKKPSIRHAASQRLKVFADYVGVHVSFDDIKSSYGPASVRPREIPTDEEIEAAILAIPNPGWKWVAACMACYGCRPFETFFCSIEEKNGLPGLFVERGKASGVDGVPRQRFVDAPFHRHWFELFDVATVRKPGLKNIEKYYEKCTLGKKVGASLRKQGFPFKPYSLRHAWAMRVTIDYGLDDTVVARLMGHTVAIHRGIYHRHLSENKKASLVLEALDRKDYSQT